ncbi:MAG: glycosyltransferase family 4 protein [Mucilaginibacter sp.]|jgi:glycosyltransferase involved in cell wall biosynthesis|uniref:glycosyltransferase family 4 protein n=1 Tax=Mucilaginibacter sp. TaxID=1882438 RepID=UPI003568A27D
MTVGLVTPYFPDKQTLDSGIANHYFLLAQSLAAEGHKVVILHVRPCYETDTDAVSEQLLQDNIHLLTYRVTAPAIVNKFFQRQWAIIDFTLKIKSMRVTTHVLNNIIRRYRIDIIETTSYFSLCFFLFYKKIDAPVAVRVSTTFSQILNDHYPFRSRALDIIGKMEIAFIKRCKYLFTHAHSHALELERLYKIAHERFEIVPHGIAIPDIDSDTRMTTSGPVVKVLYAGRYEYRKGTDVLLKAIPLVLQQFQEVLFELIGNDDGNAYREKYMANNAELTLGKIIFSGRVDESSLAQAYFSCDIFVAPSRYESFGLIFIEAMSYGKPVIGCNVGGVSEIISAGYNGLFAETGNAKSLADQIVRLIKDKSLREQLGRNARRTVEERFTGRHLAANSLAYYHKVINDFKC